ncbi:response regulator [Azospirillum sp. TSO22-1]|uniref:hybrid sensor histidine kinase/response regulator n=1 Tax=Azospirillum sp. TSO22-1 TaxID=716789 RepID=UPI000D6146A6|nr:response regulator [Azospirillum sp. TSO22-1]PWC52445.1 hypothetical protein TSO221_14175 [Azospirillum sp. TSO22-1]
MKQGSAVDGHPADGVRLLTKLYGWGLTALFALLPTAVIAYLDLYQDPALLFASHGFHEVAIGLSIVLSGFVAFVTWRCYESSGEPFLRWLTLAFLGFAIVYAPHGILTRTAHANMFLFLLYGPASRVVMSAFLFVGLLVYGRPPHPPENRNRAAAWWPWIAGLLALDVAVAAVALSPIASHPMVRLTMEYGALGLGVLGVLVLLARRIRSPLMQVYALALCCFVQSSAAFVIARPWNHLWWIAHAIFAGGFFLLSYGVVRAFQTTRSFAGVHSQEEMMERLSAAKAAAESALARLTERTEELVAANAELVAARQQAEAANLAKGRFLASLSHELRTPLTAIIGFADMIAKESLGPVGNRQYVDFGTDIRDSGQHLLELINEILDHAKADAGQLTLDEDTVDLAAAVTFSTRMLGPRAERAGVELVASVADDARFIHADEKRIRQILLNLVANAVKYTPSGGRVSITVTVEREHPVIEVADTGIGIAEEDLPRVLEAFVQIGNQANRQHDGTGLGLPLTRKLVELHGGTLALSSAPGVGTTVTIHLPEERRSRRAVAVAGAAAPSPGKPHQRTILVTDDDPLVRFGAVALLEAFGYRAIPAANANEALAVLQRGEPVDLLFTDVIMPPGMNGAELALHATRLRPGMKVLLTSGFGAHAVTAEDGLEQGLQLLAKPYAPDELKARIEGLLGTGAPERLSHAPGAASGQHRILLAEDAPLNQILVVTLLRKEGHTVDVVGNGQEAVQAVQRSIYDLVLMDVQMPGIDGIEATRRIRALPGETGAVPVVAFTADLHSQVIEACRSAGMNHLLAKPVEHAALLAAIGRWARSSTPADAP